MLKTLLSILILRYFRFFAVHQLRKNPRATIIGITGSAGKTSLRLALVQILKLRGRVKHSSHANSQSGIPLNILGLRPTSYSALDWLRLMILAPFKLFTNHEHFNYYVVEMGIDSPYPPGNMSYLQSIVRPQVGVVLNASLTHASNFDSLVKDNHPERRLLKLVQLIATEKMQLARGLGPGGVAVINLDQKEFALASQDLTTRKITFGKSPSADLCILNTSVSVQGFTLSLRYQGQKYQLILKDIFPPAYAYTFASAIATATALGIPPSLSIIELKNYHAPSGRLRLFPGKSGSTIIDSSYNASPSTMLESLQLLKSLAGRSHKIAVLGDMRELGISAKIVHKNLADWLPLYVDEVILFGHLTRDFTLPILQSQKFSVHHFTNMSDLTKYLLSIVKPKSFILVKGSQNELFMERAVEAILANSADANQLCRRGPYWDKIRASVL